jgi:hypothetical protein
LPGLQFGALFFLKRLGCADLGLLDFHNRKISTQYEFALPMVWGCDWAQRLSR